MHRKQVLALQKLLQSVKGTSVLTPSEYASLLAYVDIETSEMVYRFDRLDLAEAMEYAHAS